MFDLEKEKLNTEAGEDRFLRMMAAQTIALVEKRNNAGCIMEEGKSLADLKKIFDKFASEHRSRNQSVIVPAEAAEMICDYFEITEKKAEHIDVFDLL